MDFMDISKRSVTVQQFDSAQVEEEKIQRILEAGRWSPTAVNAQPQRILVLNTPENLAKVRDTGRAFVCFISAIHPKTCAKSAHVRQTAST